MTKCSTSITLTQVTDGKNGTNGVNGTNGKDGAPGKDGKGIASIVAKYGLSASSTTVPTSWSNNPVTPTATNKYAWSYEITTYSDNSTSETSKRIIAVYGDKGDKGDTGATGATGKWLNLSVSNKALVNDSASIISTEGSSTVTTTITANGQTTPFAKLSTITPFHLGKKKIVLKNLVTGPKTFSNSTTFSSTSTYRGVSVTFSLTESLQMNHLYMSRMQYYVSDCSDGIKANACFPSYISQQGCIKLNFDSSKYLSKGDYNISYGYIKRINEIPSTLDKRFQTYLYFEYPSVDENAGKNATVTFSNPVLFDITESGLLEYLALIGITTETQIRTWCETFIPYFEDEFVIGGDVVNEVSKEENTLNCSTGNSFSNLKASKTEYDYTISEKSSKSHNGFYYLTKGNRYHHWLFAHADYKLTGENNFTSRGWADDYWNFGDTSGTYCVNPISYKSLTSSSPSWSKSQLGQVWQSGIENIVITLTQYALYPHYKYTDTTQATSLHISNVQIYDLTKSGLDAFISLLGLQTPQERYDWVSTYVPFIEYSRPLDDIIPESIQVKATCDGLTQVETISYAKGDSISTFLQYAVSDINNLTKEQQQNLTWLDSPNSLFSAGLFVYKRLVKQNTITGEVSATYYDTYDSGKTSELQSLAKFEITASPNKYTINRRRTDSASTTISLSITDVFYRCNSFKWYKNGVEESKTTQSITIDIPYNSSDTFITIQCEGYIDSVKKNGATATFTLLSEDTTGTYKNFGQVSVLPTDGISGGQRLIEGDVIVLVTDAGNVPYVYNGSTFDAITEQNAEQYSEQALLAMRDVFYSKSGEALVPDSVKGIYGYFENIIAKWIGVQKIELLDDGYIKSRGYTENSENNSKKGFYIDTEGYTEFTDSVLNNAQINDANIKKATLTDANITGTITNKSIRTVDVEEIGATYTHKQFPALTSCYYDSAELNNFINTISVNQKGATSTTSVNLNIDGVQYTSARRYNTPNNGDDEIYLLSPISMTNGGWSVSYSSLNTATVVFSRTWSNTFATNVKWRFHHDRFDISKLNINWHYNAYTVSEREYVDPEYDWVEQSFTILSGTAPDDEGFPSNPSVGQTHTEYNQITSTKYEKRVWKYELVSGGYWETVEEDFPARDETLEYNRTSFKLTIDGNTQPSNSQWYDIPSGSTWKLEITFTQKNNTVSGDSINSKSWTTDTPPSFGIKGSYARKYGAGIHLISSSSEIQWNNRSGYINNPFNGTIGSVTKKAGSSFSEWTGITPYSHFMGLKDGENKTVTSLSCTVNNGSIAGTTLSKGDSVIFNNGTLSYVHNGVTSFIYNTTWYTSSTYPTMAFVALAKQIGTYVSSLYPMNEESKIGDTSQSFLEAYIKKIVSETISMQGNVLPAIDGAYYLGLGDATKPLEWKHIYAKGISCGTLYGNVNTEGTTNKVWGAVFN